MYPGIDELPQLCLIWQTVPAFLPGILEYPDAAVVDFDAPVIRLTGNGCWGHSLIFIFWDRF